jgi:hypothetical protein
MTDPVADAARAAALTLAPGLSPGLAAEVEAALAARSTGQQPSARYDPAVIAGLGIGAAGARAALRLLALTAAIWHNRHTAQPRTRSLIASDH